MPLKAIIDLGTNTFHLYIAEVKQGMLIEYYKLQVPVKIGSGGINKGLITPEAFQRGITALTEFKKYIDQFEVNEVIAFATSAIRNAKNSKQFIKEASDKSGITITTISGDVEATYIYKGVFHSFKFPDYPVMVMDIGGGSVEFIIGLGEQILWKQSFEIGAARLIDQFHHSNPIDDDSANKLVSYLEQTLLPLHEAMNLHQPQALIGAAGAFETLVDVVIMDLAVIPLSLSKNAIEIRREDFDVFVEIMRTSSQEQRMRLRGMTDFRVEMITVAALLMQHVFSTGSFKRIIAVNYALKEGVLFT
jgi:exopolyphosphatase/guanosine-5'-triphosphate,3'-diphosphate pyrophosphatase